MNIIHIAHWMGSINGIAEALITLTKEQIALGHNVKILCHNINDIYAANENVEKVTSKKQFKDVVQNFKPDLVIFHSLYRLHYPFFAEYLKKEGIPYAVEFHGGASRVSRNKSYIRKSIAEFLLFNKFLRNAKGFIYLNEGEQNNSIYSKIANNNIIVPNGLYTHNSFPKNENNSDDKVEFFYLGRIEYFHKGLDILLSALKKISQMPISEKIHFSIYGNGECLERLKADIANISFIDYKGELYGEEKIKVLESSDIMVLTSRSEGMPMGILEALSYGCPCLITEATNMSSIVKNGAGWITSFTEKDIIDTIHIAFEEYKNNKEAFRRKSINIAKEFEWPKIAMLSIEKYQHLLSETN